MIFFTKDPNLIFYYFFFLVGGGLELVITCSKNPNTTTEKKCFFFFCLFLFLGVSTGSDFLQRIEIYFLGGLGAGWGWGGGGDGGGRWMDNRTGPNHFAPSTS